MDALTEKAKEALSLQDSRPCEVFRAEKFQRESKKHWDLFYKRNETRFFKDRHWTTREFQELIEDENTEKVLLEVGCGVGNFVFPLLEECLNIRAFVCDISPRAVEMVKSNQNYSEDKISAFQCDITQENCFVNDMAKVDIASLIFVLSAIRPSEFKIALQNIYETLAPDGLLIFRDYAINDMAMFRFKQGSKIGDRHYLRQDGTTTYFFTLEEMSSLVTDAGFTVEVNEYIERRTVNKKEDVDVPRLFLQGKYRKKIYCYLRPKFSKACEMCVTILITLSLWPGWMRLCSN